MEREYDYWHRRGALLSINGALIPILTLIDLAWAGRQLVKEAYYASPCEQEMVWMSVIHTWVQLSFALLIGILTIQFLLVKGSFGLALAFCPRCLARCKRGFSQCQKRQETGYDESGPRSRLLNQN